MTRLNLKTIWKYLFVLISVIVLTGISSEQVMADTWENKKACAVSIGYDKYVEVGDNKSENGWYKSARYFKFTVSKGGKIEVNIKRNRQNSGYYLDYEVSLYNEDGICLATKEELTNTSVESFWIGLKQGTYYLACFNDSYSDTEDMLISLHYDSTQKCEQERNNSPEQATNMELGATYYANRHINDYDYYAVNLVKDKVYEITYIGDEHKPIADLYTSDGEAYSFFEIADGYGYSNYTQFSCYYFAVETGTHYINFKGDKAVLKGDYEYSLKVEDVTCQANGHKYTTKVTKQASYTSTGSQTKTCSVCGCVVKETIPALVGLKKNSKGVWCYYSGGKHNTSYTGLCKYNGNWFYVKKGVLDWSYTGLCKHNGNWFYVKKGVLDWSYTGLYKYNGNWFYVKKGVLDWSYTGLCKRNGNWFYVKKGVLDWSYTGLCKYNGSWFYVKKGVLDRSYTGLCKYNGSWFYVKKGVLSWSYTGLYKYNKNWYYIKNGVWQSNYTGFCLNNAKRYYIYKGIWEDDFVGEVFYGDRYWKVRKGVVVS